MDKNLLGMYDLKIERLKKALERNNMTCEVFNTEEELHDYFKTIFKGQKVVAVGGSMSLDEMHVLDLVRASDVKFLDRYAKGLTKEEINAIHHEAFNADIYLTSTNAMTTDGCLYNIDGNGNRVAAMIYGPKDVYVVQVLIRSLNLKKKLLIILKTYQHQQMRLDYTVKQDVLLLVSVSIACQIKESVHLMSNLHAREIRIEYM